MSQTASSLTLEQIQERTKLIIGVPDSAFQAMSSTQLKVELRGLVRGTSTKSKAALLDEVAKIKAQYAPVAQPTHPM